MSSDKRCVYYAVISLCFLCRFFVVVVVFEKKTKSSVMNEAKTKSGILDMLLQVHGTELLFKKSKDRLEGKCWLDSPLLIAAHAGNIPVLKWLVEMAPEKERILEEPGTIHAAVKGNHLDVVKYLVETCPSGMAILDSRENLVEAKEHLPVHAAASNRDSTILDYILKNSAKSAEMHDIGFIYSLACIACKHGCRKIIRYLANLERDGKVFVPDHMPAEKTWLRPKTVDVSRKISFLELTNDEFPTSLAHAVVSKNHSRTLNTLIDMVLSIVPAGYPKSDYVADFLTYHMNKGKSLAHRAARYGYVDIMAVFLKHVPETFELLTKRGKSPLTYAVAQRHLHMVSFIMAHHKISMSHYKTELEPLNDADRDTIESQVTAMLFSHETSIVSSAISCLNHLTLPAPKNDPLPLPFLVMIVVECQLTLLQSRFEKSKKTAISATMKEISSSSSNDPLDTTKCPCLRYNK